MKHVKQTLIALHESVQRALTPPTATFTGEILRPTVPPTPVAPSPQVLPQHLVVRYPRPEQSQR